MEKRCAHCARVRSAFIWIVTIGIFLNSCYQLAYSHDPLTAFQILKIPLALCAAALMFKIITNQNK